MLPEKGTLPPSDSTATTALKLATLLQQTVALQSDLATTMEELAAVTEGEIVRIDQRLDQLVHRAEGLATRLSTLEGWFHDHYEEERDRPSV